MNIGIIIAAVLISLAIGVLIGIAYRKKVAESKINGAEEEAKKIVNMAQIEAENLKKSKIIEAKEKSIIVKPDANSKEIKSCDKISIGITRPTNGTNDFYVVGNKVKITYNGIIMESYPAQIKATKIELAE